MTSSRGRSRRSPPTWGRTQLGQAFTDEERAWLRKLAEPGEWAIEPDAVLQELRQQGYVEEQAGWYTLAVALFRTWIRGNA